MSKTFPFVKYQGAGNDFVLLDLMDMPLDDELTREQIIQICDRRFGIGADGIILLRPHEEYDFYMQFYNSDGSSSDFCGNGGRCIVAYAHRLGVIGEETTFLAKDGVHKAVISPANWVELKMGDVDNITNVLDGYFMYTGTDHYVEMVNDLTEIDVFGQGRPLRYHEKFQPKGTNVNFISGDINQLEILTYERGVEDETLACGTGAIAAAIITLKATNKIGTFTIPVKAKGGDLMVKLQYDGDEFTDIWLCGPADFVFKGESLLRSFGKKLTN